MEFHNTGVGQISRTTSKTMKNKCSAILYMFDYMTIFILNMSSFTVYKYENVKTSKEKYVLGLSHQAWYYTIRT